MLSLKLIFFLLLSLLSSCFGDKTTIDEKILFNILDHLSIFTTNLYKRPKPETTFSYWRFVGAIPTSTKTDVDYVSSPDVNIYEFGHGEEPIGQIVFLGIPHPGIFNEFPPLPGKKYKFTAEITIQKSQHKLASKETMETSEYILSKNDSSGNTLKWLLFNPRKAIDALIGNGFKLVKQQVPTKATVREEGSPNLFQFVIDQPSKCVFICDKCAKDPGLESHARQGIQYFKENKVQLFTEVRRLSTDDCIAAGGLASPIPTLWDEVNSAFDSWVANPKFKLHILDKVDLYGGRKETEASVLLTSLLIEETKGAVFKELTGRLVFSVKKHADSPKVEEFKLLNVKFGTKLPKYLEKHRWIKLTKPAPVSPSQQFHLAGKAFVVLKPEEKISKPHKH